MQTDGKFIAAHPFRLHGNSIVFIAPDTSSDVDVIWTNDNDWIFVLESLDAVAQDFVANASFLVSYHSPFGDVPIMGGGAGSGHVGSFWQQWQGKLSIRPTEGIRFQTNFNVARWSCLGGGFYEANGFLGTFTPPAP